MCGIVAGLRGRASSGISPEDQNHIMRIMTVELLLLTESRGSDATGFALLFEDGNLRGMKHGEKATKVVSDFGRKDKANFMALMDIWKAYPKPANIAIGHCRKRTIGLASDNNNNHPFKIGDILGVHNGIVENHRKIEELLKGELEYKEERAGSVDSEMIFHLLWHRIKQDKKKKGLLTLDQAEWVVNRLHGKFAVATVNVNNPYQMMLFRDGRPVEVGISRPTGLLFVASERAFLEAALFRYNRIRHIYGLDHLPELDLKIGVMPDDHAWIFNIDKEVGKDTDVNDLIEARKMPLESARNRDWKERTAIARTTAWNPVTPHQVNRSPSTGNQTSRHVVGDKKKDNNITTSGRNHSAVQNSRDGLLGPGKVWCEKQRKYVDSDDVSSPRQTMEQSYTTMQQAVEEIPADLKTEEPESETVVEDVKFTDHTSYVTPVKPGKERSASAASQERTKSGGIKEVDAKSIVDGEKETTSHDLAERYCIQHGHFHTISDACKSADVPVSLDLSQYDFRIIASRVRKEAMKQGFIAGHKLASEQNKNKADYTVSAMKGALVKEKNKKKRAESRIVKLKALALYFIQTAPEYQKLSASTIYDLNDTLGPHYSIELEDLLELFSEYELSHRGFQLAIKALHEKRKDKEKAAEG